MSELTSLPAPVFKHCPRCGYRLRGLPADHHCPECGLRYDQRCSLFPVTNPRQVLIISLCMLGGGWAVLQNLPHLFDLRNATNMETFLAFCAVAWLIMVPCFLWVLYRRYRQGFKVAITTDGLLAYMPGTKEGLIPWTDIARVEVKPLPDQKPQVAFVHFRTKRSKLQLGGVANCFPTPDHVTRFANEVTARIAANPSPHADPDSVKPDDFAKAAP
jgi:hypothetical protein